MILNAYTFYDIKTRYYSRPFFEVTDAAAVRILSDLVNDPSTQIGRHPADYVLYGIGQFDDQSGLLLQQSAVHHIADALTQLRDQPTPPLFQRTNGGRDYVTNGDGRGNAHDTDGAGLDKPIKY